MDSEVSGSPSRPVPQKQPGAAVTPPSRVGGLRLFGQLFLDAVGEDSRSLGRRLSRRSRPAPFDSLKDTDREMDRIAILHEMRGRAAGTTIDAATWNDLDLDRVFASVDRCVSPMGEQCLYDMLRTPSPDLATLEERDALIRHLGGSNLARERIRNALATLQTADAYYLPNLFLGELPGRPRFHFIFPFLTLLAVVLVGLLFLHPQIALGALLALGALNLGIQYRYHARIRPIIRPLTLLTRLLRAAEAIGAMDDAGMTSHTERIRVAASRLEGMKRPARYLAFERGWDDIAGGVYAFANAIFLLDVNAFMMSLSILQRNRDAIADLYDAMGGLDAAISIAGYRASGPQWCKPDLSATGRELHMDAVVHPLLAGGVANDLHVSGRSVLITGSNMAGKTTFIRAVAVNAILASTIYTCTAKRYRAPFLAVRTMIGRGDDLAKGQSYFAAELDLSKSLLDAAASSRQHMFAIDEIFRGTNTVERVAAARAVLSALAASEHIVLAATHDLELLQLLDENWEFHHFRESVTDGELQFDYKIHAGPTSTHNAIRMMEVTGFPASVVADARRVAQELTRRNAAWENVSKNESQ